MAIIFVGLWVGLTIPIMLTVGFTLLKPLVMADSTGLSMLIFGLVVIIVDVYIGIQIYEKKIEHWLNVRKKKRNYP